MFKNVFFNYKTSAIHLWEQYNGENMYTEIPWVPYVYMKDPDGDTFTIYGERASKRTFKNSWMKNKFEKDNTSINLLENKVLPTIQFLVERFHGIPDEDIVPPTLKIYSLDIEVEATDGFPDYNNPIDKITAISIMDSNTKVIHSFGLKPYKSDDKHIYHEYYSDADMLKGMFEFFKDNPCDVLTGWNIWGFDIPYLIERTKLLFGNDTDIYFDFSPIKIVNTWRRRSDNTLNIDIAGVSILDYLDVYKMFTRQTPENYRLDTIALLELGIGKLDYSEYGHGANALNRLYQENWEKFIDYNQQDVKRVDELEEKLQFIQGNVMGASLLTKTPMFCYASQTKLIEGALLTYLRRNNMCAPKFSVGQEIPFPGAYVKNPEKYNMTGLHEWVVDLDIKSSYPSHVITLNMSLETYYGRIMRLSQEEIIYHTMERNFPPFTLKTENGLKKIEGKKLDFFNKVLERKLFTVSPCGTVFTNDKPGIISTVQRNYFIKRREVKALEKKAKEDGDKVRAGQYRSIQLALKIILNSTYGATSVGYSRYFNPDISEAITTSAVNTIKQAEKFANDFMNDETERKKIEEMIGEYF